MQRDDDGLRSTIAEARGEVVRLKRLYAARSEITQAVVWTADRGQLLQQVCSALTEAGPFEMAWIGWHDPVTQRIVPVSAAGAPTRALLDGIEIYGDDRPEGRGPTGVAFREHRTCVINDLVVDARFAPWRHKLPEDAVCSAAGFPIREGGVVRGTLSVYAFEAGFFRDEEIAVLEAASRDIAFGLDNLARDAARRHAEATLRRERDFSDAVLRSLPGVLYLYDQQGRFLRWNENFERVTGYSGSEISAMQPLDFFTADDRPRVEARIAEVFAIGASSVEAAFLAKDGATTPYQFTGVRTVIAEEPCLIGVGIDISARVTSERALREANESLESKVTARTHELHDALGRAEAADRMKSAFLATMSHELRTPLNSIIGFTGIVLAQMAGPLTPEQHKQLGMVRGSAHHLLELINDVLDLSKIEADQLEVHAVSFDVRRSIERTLAMVAPFAAGKHIAIEQTIDPELREMVSDGRRVEQILLNVLNNAIKFTERGTVGLCADVVERDEATALRVVITDTGIGIRDEDLASLFVPFRQLDTGLSRRHEGTGLGLAICRRLAVLLGGEITATSVWGRGSELTIVLPLVISPVLPPVAGVRA